MYATRYSSIWLVAAVLAVSGCGSSDDPPADLPPITHGDVAVVSDLGEAEAACDGDAVSDEAWAAAYGDRTQVTFDLPGTGNDYTCVRASLEP